MPLDVSQSQISVPSRSIASTWKPPPGSTTTAAPVFFPFGAYTVIVGRVTLLTHVHGLPATGLSDCPSVSGPETGFASGATPGHIGIWVCPGEGCQGAADG